MAKNKKGCQLTGSLFAFPIFVPHQVLAMLIPKDATRPLAITHNLSMAALLILASFFPHADANKAMRFWRRC